MSSDSTPPVQPARRFVALFLGIFVLGLAGIATLNVAADAFGVFGTTRRIGLNDRTPNTSGFDRMAKPYDILRVHPRTVLMGSSTAHSGFLTLEFWATGLPKPAYNYALLGANVHEVRLSLAQALREAPVETAIVVADFFGYNVHYADNDRFKASRLDAASHRHWLGFTLEDLGAFTLGVDSLKMSWSTLRDSRAAAAANASAGSARETTDRSREWLVHFRNCERSYVPKWFPPPARRYEFVDRRGGDRLADYDELMRLCMEKGARLVVMIPPIHARFQEAMATAGAWPHYEAFKRVLFAHTRVHLRRLDANGKSSAVELWDFSLFNDRTCEKVPADGGPPMQWWHDSAHFTPDFGRDILNEIQGHASAAYPPLGVRLTPGSVDIETHLAAIRTGLTGFRATQPTVVADVHAALGLAAPPPLPP